MSKPAQAGESNGAGRAFLPLSKFVTIRVGRRPPQPLRRVSLAVSVDAFVRLLQRESGPGGRLGGSLWKGLEPAGRTRRVVGGCSSRWA